MVHLDSEKTKSNKMKTIQLSDKVVVSDPCYEVDNGWNMTLNRVKEGEYIVDIRMKNNRVSSIALRHIDHEDCKINQPKGGIGVDSGQVGIFSYDTYRNDSIFADQDSDFAAKEDCVEDGDLWYGFMCDFTLSEQQWGAYDNGVVTSSGWGDGVYTLNVAMNRNKIVGFRIEFF
jgi:hypothetical protein